MFTIYLFIDIIGNWISFQTQCVYALKFRRFERKVVLFAVKRGEPPIGDTEQRRNEYAVERLLAFVCTYVLFCIVRQSIALDSNKYTNSHLFSNEYTKWSDTWLMLAFHGFPCLFDGDEETSQENRSTQGFLSLLQASGSMFWLERCDDFMNLDVSFMTSTEWKRFNIVQFPLYGLFGWTVSRWNTRLVRMVEFKWNLSIKFATNIQCDSGVLSYILLLLPLCWIGISFT